jgi:hypothetical protein
MVPLRSVFLIEFSAHAVACDPDLRSGGSTQFLV